MDDEQGYNRNTDLIDFSDQEDELLKKMRLPPKPLPKDYWMLKLWHRIKTNFV